MNKRKYIFACLILLLLLATNIANDKYYMNYQNKALTVNNATEKSRGHATIIGDNTNEGDFIETPKVNLPKGDYKINIKYKTDTDLNYIKIDGKMRQNVIEILENEQYLYSVDKEKVINIRLDEDINNFKVKLYFAGQGTLIFRNMTIESVKITNIDTIAWFLITLTIMIVIGILAYYNPTEENRKKILIILSLLAITGIASYPMLNNYITEGHDIAFHLTRIEGIKSGLLSGQFPVRVHSSTLFDYGYATSIFYPELFMYIPAFMRIAGVSMTGTVQIFIILINFATASTMYISAYKLSKVRSIGILSSILYVLASYHLCNIYTRFAIGEALAMVFIPLIIYGVYELICNDYKKWKYAVIGVTGLLQSHILSTLITIAFIILIVLFYSKNLLNKNRLIACIKASIMIVLIDLWYIIPLISMMKQEMNVTSLGRDVDKISLYVTELFQNFTVNGENRNVIGTSLDGVMSLHIGLPILIGVMLFVYALVKKIINNKSQENLVVSLFGLGLLSAFATTNLFPWRFISSLPMLGKIARMIQFPWRILVFAVAFLSIVASYGIFYFVKKAETRRMMIVTIFTISALLTSHYLDNAMEKDIYCYKGANIAKTGIGTGEYYYKGTSSGKLINRGEIIETSSEEVTISEFKRVNGKLNIDLVNNSDDVQFIEIPLAYYPFYRARLNCEVNLETTKGVNNVVRIIIPSNAKGKIEVQYAESIFWRLSDIISAIAIIIFVLSFSKKNCICNNVIVCISEKYKNKSRLLDK